MRAYDRRPAEYMRFEEKKEDSPVVLYTLLGLIGLSIILAIIM